MLSWHYGLDFGVGIVPAEQSSKTSWLIYKPEYMSHTI